MKSPQRFGVVFPWGGDDRIEITFWVENYIVYGEAYFKKDDLCATIVNGEFQHPFTERKFKLAVSTFGTESHDAVLEEQIWKNVGRNKPRKCENQKV